VVVLMILFYVDIFEICDVLVGDMMVVEVF